MTQSTHVLHPEDGFSLVEVLVVVVVIGGQVEVTGATSDTFTIIGHSQSGNNFRIVHGTGGTVTRTCSTAGHEGCPASSQW